LNSTAFTEDCTEKERDMARLNPRPSHATNAPSSRYNSTTPAPSGTSDQENRDPDMHPRGKGKGRATDGPRPQRSSLPTPTSEGSDNTRGQKRKAPEEELDTDEEEELRFKKYFDPNQQADVRREVKRKSRALERDFQGMC